MSESSIENISTFDALNLFNKLNEATPEEIASFRDTKVLERDRDRFDKFLDKTKFMYTALSLLSDKELGKIKQYISQRHISDVAVPGFHELVPILHSLMLLTGDARYSMNNPAPSQADGIND